MKKFLVLAMAATSMLAFSCNPKNDKGTDKEKILKDDSKAEDEDDGSDLKKAAVGYCECFNDNFGDLDPKVKKMIIKAGNSDDPMSTLQREAAKIGDPEEQQRIGEEMQKMSTDKEMEACGKKISKKYGFDENDKKVQKRLMNYLLNEEDCEVLGALMKIGLSQSNNTTDATDDEEAPRKKRTTTDDEE
jgi:hypothetical protein